MNKQERNRYSPDTVTAPGTTLNDILLTIGMSQSDLAERTGRSIKNINEIIKGKAPIKQDTSLSFEKVLGVPASFWNKRESDYQEFLAKRKERKSLEKHIEWLKRFPVQVIIKNNWISKADNPIEQLQYFLQYFGVSSPKQWESVWLSAKAAAFRKSPAFDADPYAISAWLRYGEIQARKIPTRPYNEKTFKDVLSKARELTIELPEKFQPLLINLCATAGVALVFVPELPKIRISGATKWLQSDKALIQLCLRYKKNDQLWFSFFHEASHILLHGKKAVFIEDEKSNDSREQQADKLAADLLIPPQEWLRILSGNYSRVTIRSASKRIGIAPGILVGRLQHERLIPYSHLNDLKETYIWKTP